MLQKRYKLEHDRNLRRKKTFTYRERIFIFLNLLKISITQKIEAVENKYLIDKHENKIKKFYTYCHLLNYALLLQNRKFEEKFLNVLYILSIYSFCSNLQFSNRKI